MKRGSIEEVLVLEELHRKCPNLIEDRRLGGSKHIILGAEGVHVQVLPTKWAWFIIIGCFHHQLQQSTLSLSTDSSEYNPILPTQGCSKSGASTLPRTALCHPP